MPPTISEFLSVKQDNMMLSGSVNFFPDPPPVPFSLSLCFSSAKKNFFYLFFIPMMCLGYDNSPICL